MENNNKINRRQFLGQASCAAVGSISLYNTLLNLMATGSAAGYAAGGDPDDYKAMICLFLPGGLDSYNVLMPYGQADYNEYAASRQDVAIPRDQLLPINALNMAGREMAVHPGLGELRGLFNTGKCAFLANVGSLVKPTSRTDYDNGVSLPYGLFSHSDQIEQWQTSIPDSRAGTGWGGRIADLLAPNNGLSNVSMSISISGNNLYQVGNTVLPYTVEWWGAEALWSYRDWHPQSDVMTAAVDSMLAQQYGNILQDTYSKMKRASLDARQEYQDALAGGLPPGVTFPDNSLGNSLKQIATVIGGRSLLGVKRQVFFLQWGGWDFHDEVVANMGNMLPVVSQAVAAFYNATVALGVADKVTLFTASDFGRSLTSNARGTDHAWGGNHIVVGGAVDGQKIHGSFPDLALDNPLDVGRGSLIPTTSVDQYGAELALWMGVPKTDLPLIFPNISRFYNVNSAGKPIGFMK